jgi:6-phosphogluconolactonase
VNEPELIVVRDLEAVAAESAGRIAAALTGAVAARGRADWATTGGSTAPAIYRRLAAEPLRSEVPWAAVHTWWGDDRYVSHDHPLSNVRPFDDILLGSLPQANLHPFPTSIAIGRDCGAAWCAAELARELRAAPLDREGDWPVFDLVVVGVGPDGHLLSVFPGSEAFGSGELALAIPAPTHVEPHVERVTLNPAVLGVARGVLVTVSGTAKASIVADIFGPARDPVRWPAQLARRAGATWVLDADAAARLRDRT